jgi:hypothetical protein
MRQPSIKIIHIKALKSGDNPGAQSPAHSDSVRPTRHRASLLGWRSIRRTR